MSNLSPEMTALLAGAKKKYARNNTNVLKMKEGKTIVRLVVPDPKKKFWADRSVHWIKADENDKPLAVVGCEDKVFGRPCAVCNAINHGMRAMADEESRKLANSWKGRDTVLLQVYVPAGPDASDKAQVLEVSKTLFTEILSVVEEWGFGTGLILERTGRTAKDTRYKAQPCPKPVNLPANIMESVIDLDEWIATEDFRENEDKKAMTAIAGITGVMAPALGASAAPKAIAHGGIDTSALAAASPAPAHVAPAPAHVAADPPKPTKSEELAAVAPSIDTFDKDFNDADLEALLGAI